MCQTLFTIPAELFGHPLFGIGWLLALWSVIGAVYAVWLVRTQGWNFNTGNQLLTYLICAGAICFVPPWLGLLADGGLPIRGYGVLLLLAVVAAVGLSLWRARRVGQDPEMILSLATWLFVGGIAGARAFYVIEYWDKFQKPTLGQTIKSMLNVAEGGLVVYGSLLAGALALVIFSRKHRLPVLAMCDLAIPGVVLGMAIGRLGCFMNGCCYGGPSDLPWAVTFPWDAPPFKDQAFHGKLPLHGLEFGEASPQPAVITAVTPDSAAARAGLKAGDQVVEFNGVRILNIADAEEELLRINRPNATIEARVAGEPRPYRWTTAAPLPRSLHVHPAQLYSAFDALLLCGFLLAYSPFRRRDGELLALAMMIHPISRFLLEIIRIDESAVFHTRMSISQNISLLLFVGGIALWAYLLSHPKGVTWDDGHAAAVAH